MLWCVCLPDMDKEGRTSYTIVYVWTLKIGCMWKPRIYKDKMIDGRLSVLRYCIQNKEATLKLQGLKPRKDIKT